jgi:TolA-binding protein
MFCPQCGARVEKDHQYCTGCGAKLPISAQPQPLAASDNESSQTPPPASTVQKKPMPLWFKIVAFIAVLALIGVTAGILFTESLVDVVDNQLESLRKDDISKAYYSYTSKDFQAATSLEQFRDFVEAYPFLLKNQSTHFTQRSIENNVGTLTGKITAEDHTVTPIEYKLVKEDGKWKILSIRLLKPGMRQETPGNEQTQTLIDTVRKQMQALERHELEAAYEQYTAKEFKQATSLQDFKKFVKKYPIITYHDTVSFHKPVIKKGVSTVSAILHSGTTSAYLKYYLIYEDQTWKIWSMRILSPSEEDDKPPQEKKNAQEEQDPLALGEVLLGTEVDEDEVVRNPRTKFNISHEEIFAGINVKNASVGDTIELSLQHVETGKKTDPTLIKMDEAGNTYSLSVFSPPENGWPKGRYKLFIQASTGSSKIVEFIID